MEIGNVSSIMETVSLVSWQGMVQYCAHCVQWILDLIGSFYRGSVLVQVQVQIQIYLICYTLSTN